MDRKVYVNFIEDKQGGKQLATATCPASELTVPVVGTPVYLDIDGERTFVVSKVSFFYARTMNGVHSELELNAVNIFVSNSPEILK